MPPLLRRQLQGFVESREPLPDDPRPLLDALREARAEALDEDERRLVEDALMLVSQELLRRSETLHAEAPARSADPDRDPAGPLRGILAALPDILLVVTPSGELREVHAPGRSFLSEPAQMLVGRPLIEVLPESLYRVLSPALEQAASSGTAQRCELTYSRGRDRRRYEARLSVSPVGDVVILVRDQTERLDMAERLRVADRMASVGTLAAGVAHELNNPLAYVLGNLELLNQQLRATWVEPTQLQLLVDEALDGARRMRSITQDLRMFSQPHSEAVKSIDPRTVLDSALNIAGNEIRHRAMLRREYEDVPAVRGEASKLGQVFLNLVVNAVQALPMGEAVRNEILVRTYSDEQGYAVIEVCDTGPGIPMHLASRIFEPFVTTKPREVGTGLGLSICHNIVTSMGGHISVHPRKPKGTVFRVRLPPSDLVVTAPPPPTPVSLPRDVPVGGGRRVLIIDDDPLVANSLRRLLANREVQIADSGRRGIEILRENDRFEVVLCDLMMPEVSGIDVYETVLEERPDLAERFIFMTGGAFTERARAFLDRVSNPKLEKPFDGKTLRMLVSGHGTGR
ncbi:hybrid sensor histidine kinase/response regulator [Paraliomyxa miuraensis]|uniref:hybrid sensor histidine kinase/response regulator n=1 Tax=Paraliomyxa miuraensis TaxID=376150 RepID=UPI0022533935|nr:hybrid sensor histidine kinase/response regulator [Paraliomyxa miuraensis]MCX4241855.1 ATP-binding protein [Paraliomyxa miuraensis]